eukprot:g4143.t1.2.5e174189.2.5e1746aa g4143  g4143.t1 contig15:437983-438657(+)
MLSCRMLVSMICVGSNVVCVYIYIYLLCVGCCHRHSPLLLSRRHVACRLPRPNSGMRVESYGTGTQVRLPGKSSMEPRIFKFGTPYSEMYASMSATPEDEAFFVHNGVLQLCKRGSSVKLAPQRWQDTPSKAIQTHDVVIAFEERIYDAVVEDLQTREPTEDFKAIHVICLDTKV